MVDDIKFSPSIIVVIYKILSAALRSFQMKSSPVDSTGLSGKQGKDSYGDAGASAILLQPPE